MDAQYKSVIIAVYALISCLAAVECAAARENIKRFQIERQPLADALKAFAVQADVEVFAPSELVGEHIAASLKGEYDQRTALSILLDGAGLDWRVNEFGTILIQASRDPENAVAHTFAPAHDGAERYEQIIVTARKRREMLQDAPLSIVVLSGDALERRAFDDLGDYIGFLPGLAGTAPEQDRFVLNVRGLAAPIPRIATVGVYVDDVSITQNSTSGGDIEAFDLERVELLRGPQGTLYGEASLGGALRFVTQKPKNEFEAKLRGVASSTENGEASYALHGVVNIPVVKDIFALRLMSYQRHDSGYVDNAFTGEGNFNGFEAWGGRLSAFLTPTDKLAITGVANYNKQEADGFSGIIPALGDFIQSQPDPTNDSDEALYASLTIDYDLGWGEITSITGYTDRTVNLEGGFFLPDFSSTTEFAGALLNKSHTRVFSEELRLATANETPSLNFLIGLYYRRSEIDSDNTILNPPFFQAAPLNLPPEQSSRSFSERTHLAAFGEVYFEFLDGFELTLGGRVFEESLTSDRVDTTFSGVTPKAELAYHVTDGLTVYALAAAGYRPGGISSALSPARRYEEDTSWNYELGWKSAWLDDRVALNAAAFYIDWRDVQIAVPVPGAPLSFTVDNAGAAHSAGAEIDLSLTGLVDGLTVKGGAAWIKAQLDEDALDALDGARLPYVPEISFSILADYAFSLSSAYDGFISASYNFNGKQFVHITNLPAPTASVVIPTFIKGNALLNLHAGVGSENYTLSLFADNVLNSKLRYGEIVPQAAMFAQRPRTVGVMLRVNI